MTNSYLGECLGQQSNLPSHSICESTLQSGNQIDLELDAKIFNGIQLWAYSRVCRPQ